LTVSEQQAEQTSGEQAVSASLDAPVQPAPTSWQEKLRETANTESPALVPEQAEAPTVVTAKIEVPKVEAPKAEPKAEAAEVEAAKPDAPKPDAPKSDTPKAEAPRAPGKLMIMSSGDRHWERKGVDPEAESEPAQAAPGQRRLSAMAAVVALAAVAGALGGALATAGLGHLGGGDATISSNLALDAAVARVEAELLNVKVSVEHSSKMGMTQFNKTSDRLDKVEKAQAEPAAKLAKLSETVEKLRAAPAAPMPVAAVPAAAKDVTGSIAPPATPAATPVPLPAPKPEVARLPTVEGWVLRDVANGGALIEGRRGIYEVYTGDPVPGVGRVDAIRKQDGHWVVVTSKGLIVSR
jgi:hypothetical protein